MPSDEDLRYANWLLSKATKVGDCLICHFKPTNKSGHINIRDIGNAHRFVYATLCKMIPDGLLACHSCDTPACINPSHIFIGTNADNKADSVAKGRHKSQKPKSLNTFEELQVYYLLSQYISYAKIGVRFSVSDQLIYQMAKGKRGIYAHPSR